VGVSWSILWVIGGGALLTCYPGLQAAVRGRPGVPTGFGADFGDNTASYAREHAVAGPVAIIVVFMRSLLRYGWMFFFHWRLVITGTGRPSSDVFPALFLEIHPGRCRRRVRVRIRPCRRPLYRVVGRM
jgi:hypothetical protein